MPRPTPPRMTPHGARLRRHGPRRNGAARRRVGPFSRHPRAWGGAAAGLAVVVFGTGSVALGASLGPETEVRPAPTATATAAHPSPTPTPTRETPATEPAAAPVRTCSVASLADDDRLGTLEAQVLDPKTGQVLFDRDGDKPAPTASVMKILTAAAALKALGPDHRVPTTVETGPEPGSIVLVGGGDVTLSRLPGDESSFYTGAPHLDQLAQQVKAAWPRYGDGEKITKIYLDATLFGGPKWQPSWDEHEEREVEGSTSYITALQVDGDRQDPTALESPRSTTPIKNAGEDFAKLFDGDPDVSILDKSAPEGHRLGVVYSQPVSALLKQALEVSDNTIMEELARLVAIKEGTGNTFEAENEGTLKALAGYGIDTAGLHIADGSGLSGDNAVPPSYLTRLFVKILKGEDGLDVVYDSLPVSGESGTLGPGYARFQGDSQAARGKVNAKTGWIDRGYTLAGVVHAQDGTDLTFAVYALGDVGNDAKAAIDALVTGFYRCGGNLSDH